MTLRTVSAAVAAGAFTAWSLGAGAVPAHAGLYRNGLIQLSMTKEGPTLGDNNALIYSMHLHNEGPVAATGIVVRVTGWFCLDGGWTLPPGCTPLADPLHQGVRMDYLIRLDSLAPGRDDTFPVTTWLASEGAGTVRTTVEVVAVDQWDNRSVPGACVEGWVPQADCVSDVVALS
jgi:hypothetical protein